MFKRRGLPQFYINIPFAFLFSFLQIKIYSDQPKELRKQFLLFAAVTLFGFMGSQTIIIS